MFDIVTARDFYAMLVEDFDDFMAEPHSVRRALHCAISAYHLHDWVWADWLRDDDALRASLGIGSKKGHFTGWLIRGSPWFQIVANVANGTKHSIGRMDVQGLRVLAAPFAFDQPTAGFDEGAWDGPIRYVSGSLPVGPHGKGYLVFDLGEGAGEDQRFHPVAHILEVVLRLWRDFFRRYRPGEEIPISRHHVD